MLGPGKTGRKLPKMPIIIHTKPIVRSNTSINYFLVFLKIKAVLLNKIKKALLSLMNMRKIILILLFLPLLFSSCQYFDKQVPSERELLQKELKAINWKEVDEFPSVADCEKIENKTLRQQCFFEVMTQLIQEKLSVDTLSILYPELDTIEVKVTIFPNATMQFEPQFPKDSVAYDTIKIDSILKARLVDFPKVNPAIKRGVPVKTQFILPVILKVE
jgi:hypothetical protein